MLCDCKQTARTWRRDDTASSSKYPLCSITAWTNCLSALLDRYACVKLIRLPASSVGSTRNDARPDPTPRHRSAASSVPPSPPSGNCSVVADPSRPRLAMICSSREQNNGPNSVSESPKCGNWCREFPPEHFPCIYIYLQYKKLTYPIS